VSTGTTLIADFETDSSLTLGGYKINYIAVDLVNQGKFDLVNQGKFITK
jgi:hypothetical protein